MTEDNVLVSVTVSRDKDEIHYKLDCASNLSNEELEYYLEEIVKGICTWKPGICKEHTKKLKGTIKKQTKKK
jgi:hypothetical protein